MKNTTLVTGIFKNSQDAANAITRLLQGGVHRDDISVVASEKANMEAFGIETQSKASQGAVLGGGIGGTLGALVAGFTAVGAIATGGVGILVAGPIVAALAGAGAGAAAGGIIGGLIGYGIPEHQVKFFQDAIDKGSVLVGARVPDKQVDWVVRTFESYGAMTPTSSTTPSSGRNAAPAVDKDAYNGEGLRVILVEQLKDMYYAEQQLVDALTTMRDAASSPELARAFADHLTQTRLHVQRLEQVFESIGVEAEAEKCPAINGIIAEAKDLMKHHESAAQRDAALICGAQKAEHYEMATYGCLTAYAKTLGLTRAAELLAQTLQEETEADRRLSQVAESGINQSAARGQTAPPPLPENTPVAGPW